VQDMNEPMATAMTAPTRTPLVTTIPLAEEPSHLATVETRTKTRRRARMVLPLPPHPPIVTGSKPLETLPPPPPLLGSRLDHPPTTMPKTAQLQEPHPPLRAIPLHGQQWVPVEVSLRLPRLLLLVPEAAAGSAVIPARLTVLATKQRVRRVHTFPWANMEVSFGLCLFFFGSSMFFSLFLLDSSFSN
jgi:hypothetical protein